jgi:DNA polymerase-3 subunit gamma/tau
MSYLVLARKYRPQTFDDVIGQDHITNNLKKAIDSGRVHHAYLFCGPRGIGKTTCARILAKELNKVKAKDQAETLDLDSSLDIIEIDGASNRGIDEIRTLRENVKFVPMSGRYKVYIVDEVHMLTTEAFNALLKTLEEPPEHVKFIFATTDPSKLPMTVISRCQQFTFKRIPLEISIAKLKEICAKEGFKAEEDALYAIAKASQGSLRDALSVLDQLISFCDGTVRASDVNGMLGLVETQLVFDIADAVAAGDCAKALTVLETILSGGKDIKQLNGNLIEHFRHLMIMKVGGEKLQALIDYPRVYKEAFYVQAGKLTIQAIIKAIELFIEAQDTARITENARFALELALAKLTCPETSGTSAITSAATVRSAQSSASTPRPTGAAAVAKSAVVPRPALASKSAAPVPASGSGTFIKNNKGSVNLSPLATSSEEPAAIDLAGNITLEDIKKQWNALTFAVSHQRVSLGAYLQEGYPLSLVKDRLCIGFSKDHAFPKECLDTSDNLKLIGRVFSGILGSELLIELIMEENAVREAAPAVENALGIFKGEVVNEWHSQE